MAEMMIKPKLDQLLQDHVTEEDRSGFLDKAQHKIDKVESFFSQLDKVYVHRQKYSLHWAYDNASQLMTKKLQKIEATESEHESTEHNVTVEIKQEIKKASRQYRLLSNITLYLDIIISVALILGVTMIAQTIERNLEELFIVTTFIGGIALFKVSLDRFYIIPRIDNWGWNRYHNLTHKISDRVALMIFHQYIHHSDIPQVQTTENIISKSNRILYPDYSFSPTPYTAD